MTVSSSATTSRPTATIVEPTIQPISETTYRLSHCEVCGEASAATSLDLGSQAMCDDLVPVGSDRQSVRYPIEISICGTCLTAHQVQRIKKETLFPKEYHYRPRFTKDVLDGMAALVDELEQAFGPVAGKKVVDVGCNDGSLLSIFNRRGAVTGGIEPTDASLEAEAAGHHMVHDFFSPASAEKLTEGFGKPDVITFTNVFAHIESLPDAIRAVRSMVAPGTLVVIENHYLGTVLDTFQFDTFYHEHPRTYSKRSFEIIAGQMGGELLNVSFPKRYGGNIRVIIGNFGETVHQPIQSDPLKRDESSFVDRLGAMQTDVDVWKTESMTMLADLQSAGVQMHGKSFPGRAAILAHLLEVDADQQPVVYEKPGSLKIGNYLPGSRIEIVSDDVWAKDASAHPEAMLIWGWHIADEIGRYLRAAGYQGRLFTPLPTLREIH